MRLGLAIAIVAEGGVARVGGADVGVSTVDFGGYTVRTSCVVVVLVAVVGSGRGWPRGWLEGILALGWNAC